MKICKIWDFSLPLNHNGRGPRSLRNILHKKCLVHDYSYVRPIQLNGNQHSILDLLKQFMVNIFLISFHS
jgi:hypothetical protein